MNKFVATATVIICTLGLSACKFSDPDEIDGNIINTRVVNGQTEVQVKDLVNQGLDNAPWVKIPFGKEQDCTVGDYYPDCLG